MLEKKRCGFVALIGRPNVGKSSLMNELVGQKISIVASKVQTTRHRVLGIRTDEAKLRQALFLDLPGLIPPKDALGKACYQTALSGAKEADCLLYVLDASTEPAEFEEQVASLLAPLRLEKPLFVVLNKIDKLIDPASALKKYACLLEPLHCPSPMLVSAESKAGLGLLLESVLENLPEGELLFDPEEITDRPIRFLVSEYIREAAINLTSDELPHAVGVMIVEYRLPLEAGKPIYIRADLLAETESQKGILIGKGAAKIKRIGQLARAEIEKLTGEKVFLELKVKVKDKWRMRDSSLREMGYKSDKAEP